MEPGLHAAKEAPADREVLLEALHFQDDGVVRVAERARFLGLDDTFQTGSVGFFLAVFRHEVAHRGETLGVTVERRPASEQTLRVGVLRRREDLAGVALLDDLAAVHDNDVIGDVGDDAEIVRDEEHRHFVLFLELREELEDLLLNGHVEGRRRLVGDEELGAATDRHGDHDPLLLAARHLVRVRVDLLRRIRNADLVQEVDRALVRFARRKPLVQAQDFGDLVTHREDGVERRHRLLEDHRDPVAADLAHLGFGHLHEVLAAEDHLAADDLAGRVRDEAHGREARDGFARTGFADEAHGLALLDIEGNVVDGVHDAILESEINAKILNT